MIENDREREVIMPFTHKQIAILKKELPQQLRFLMLVCLYKSRAAACRMLSHALGYVRFEEELVDAYDREDEASDAYSYHNGVSSASSRD